MTLHRKSGITHGKKALASWFKYAYISVLITNRVVVHVSLLLVMFSQSAFKSIFP